MTKEDYISFLKRKINYNKEKIILLEDKNKKIIEKVKRLKKITRLVIVFFYL